MKNSNPLKKEDFKKLQIVWIWEPWVGRPIKVCIKSIEDNGCETQGFVRCSESLPGTMGRAFDEIWLTKEDLLRDAKASKNAVIAKYREQIKDVKDLVAFMYRYHVGYCEEYTNEEATLVACEKARELLGVDLKQESM